MSNAAVRISLVFLAGVLAASAAEATYQLPPKGIVNMNKYLKTPATGEASR